MAKLDSFSAYIKKNKDVFTGILTSLIRSLFLKVLNIPKLGNIKGWIVATILKEFSSEVIELIRVNVEYIEIKNAINKTPSMEDRDEATDVLNDIMR